MAAKLDPRLESTLKAGVEQGRREMKREILDLLEGMYMDPQGPERGTPEAKAIIALAAVLSQGLSAP